MEKLTIRQRITNRSEVSIDKYLQEISKEDLLSPEEEVELVRKIKQKDEEAFEKLVRSNLRFVFSVAKQYQNKGLSLGDLINEGNLGLIKAARRFDETKGFKFITYAVWWIRQSIGQALAEEGRMIRLPVNKIGAIRKINEAFSELEQKHEREPSLQEIFEVLELSPKEIKDAWSHNNKPLSMDAPIDKEGEENMYNTMESDESLSPDKDYINKSLNLELERALSSLNQQEATVIRLYYGIGDEYPTTLYGIGQKFNLTRERVRQIKTNAIKKLRNYSRSKALKSYLV